MAKVDAVVRTEIITVTVLFLCILSIHSWQRRLKAWHVAVCSAKTAM